MIDRIGDRRFEHRFAGLGIERDELVVERHEVDVAVRDRNAGGSPGRSRSYNKRAHVEGFVVHAGGDKFFTAVGALIMYR